MPRGQTRPDCYDYVRRYYGVPAYIGVRVTVRGKQGVLVNRSSGDQYVYIKFDGEERVTGPFHPTDGISYLTERSEEAKSVDAVDPAEGIVTG